MVAAAVLPPGAAAGRPKSFRPGAPAAYWIWQNHRGGWFLRTTTAGAHNTFRGHIRSPKGQVMNVHPTRTVFSDRVWRTRDGWAFSFATAEHADGFSFTTSDGGCVEFDLQTDGGPQPKRIVLGKGEGQPPSNRFLACP
jgi:hypothetical protein